MDNVGFLTDPRIIKALAHPLRLRLLTALDGREASPSQLSRELGVELGTVSYHVRRLHGMGLIRLVGERQQRGAVEHRYTAGDRWVIPGHAWKNLPSPLKKSVNRMMVDQIGDEIYSAVSSGGFDQPYSHMTLDSLALDAEGARQLAEEVACLMERASAIEAEARDRLEASNSGEGRKVNLALLLFDAHGKGAD
jgi:DNA-binding transcriptional ArsR family regulator